MTIESIIAIGCFVIGLVAYIGWSVKCSLQNIANKTNSHNTYITNNYYGTKTKRVVKTKETSMPHMTHNYMLGLAALLISFGITFIYRLLISGSKFASSVNKISSGDCAYV